MKQVLVSGSGVSVEDVPSPTVRHGTVLVAVEHSCVSVGTELSGVAQAESPLWKKALRNPEKVAKAVELARAEGVRHAADQIRGKLGTGEATGYSATGRVIEVGQGISDLAVGDRVACAGAGLANHAEQIRVPRNLVVKVPTGVTSTQASTVTLGAIALQGVRRAQTTLGETFVVVGLGILGQLTVQLLRADGCRVIALDLDQERVRLAIEHGAEGASSSPTEDTADLVRRVTGGLGVDGVIITASTPSDEVVAQAFDMCRRKGRVVLVGDVGLALKRADFYAKELDFLVSTSYGPGRYDRTYEHDGLDYPISYVRWTENRNMAAYLDLIASGDVQLDRLLPSPVPVTEAARAYADLRGPDRPLTALLAYDAKDVDRTNRVANPTARKSRPGRIRIGVIGAGGFAQAVHLPNLRRKADTFEVAAVCTDTGSRAVSVARQYGAAYASSDVQELFDDPTIDAVVISTRHDTHAPLAARALAAGKHVLLEKPLALDADGLASVLEQVEDDGSPILLTGFNRRFSPHVAPIRRALASRANPAILTYRMNAGRLPADHWVHGPEGGGRNLGEACHIYDLFTFLLDARVTEVATSALASSSAYATGRDNFVATLTFNDGSLATLTYTSLGASTHPKEQLEVFCDDDVISLDDYRLATSANERFASVETPHADKGHLQELEAFGRGIRNGTWPIPRWQQVQATEVALRVEDGLPSATDRPDTGLA